MTELYLPKQNQKFYDFASIKEILNKYHVEIDRWEASEVIHPYDVQEKILQAYAHRLIPYMKNKGFSSADVVNITKETGDLLEIRQKFLKEHTHQENEVRFFVDGSGFFWFHFEDGVVARLKCVKGDFLSVPKDYKHWFDMAPDYFVKAIRIFSNKEGWIPYYTNSAIESIFKEI